MKFYFPHWFCAFNCYVEWSFVIIRWLEFLLMYMYTKCVCVYVIYKRAGLWSYHHAVKLLNCKNTWMLFCGIIYGKFLMGLVRKMKYFGILFYVFKRISEKMSFNSLGSIIVVPFKVTALNQQIVNGQE